MIRNPKTIAKTKINNNAKEFSSSDTNKVYFNHNCIFEEFSSLDTHEKKNVIVQKKNA